MGKKHPAAKLAAVKAAAEERRSLPQGWRWPNGYIIRLYCFDGSVHYRETAAGASYVEAAAERDRELARSDVYEKAWLEQRR